MQRTCTSFNLVAFLKKKFVKSEIDTPERSIGSFATVKPDVLPEYVKAISEYKRAEKEWFNRDVIGECSRWVNNTRALIRPAGLVRAMLVLGGMVVAVFTGDYERISAASALASDTLTGVRASCELMIRIPLCEQRGTVKDYFPEKLCACKCGCGFDRIDPQLVDRLNLVRELAGVPFEINSACRCEEHNMVEGGKPGSAHTTGEAVDIRIHNNVHRFFVLVGLFGAGFKRVGLGKDFIHADVAQNLPQQVAWTY